VFVFTVLTLAATMMHLNKLHLAGQFGTRTRIVTIRWIAIYALVPALMLIILAGQARTRGADPPLSAALPAWLYILPAVPATVLLALGVALFAVPGQAPGWRIAALWRRAGHEQRGAPVFYRFAVPGEL